MKIGIIGNGVVGHATARSFMEFAEVKIYDTLPERRTHTLPEVTSCDIVFLCLPTPQKKEANGTLSTECDISAVEDFCQWHEGFNTTFVLRSTLPIGTTRKLAHKYRLPHLVHSPEFLTARCSVTDAQVPSRNIIGFTGNGFSAPELVRLYQTRYTGIPCYVMSSDESEAVKLFLNSFFAIKVAYFNEINSLCEKLNLDWESVLEGMLSDGRIAHSHTRVPGPDGKYGWGGSCLPKDLANLRHCFQQAKVAETICTAAHVRNECYDRKRK